MIKLVTADHVCPDYAFNRTEVRIGESNYGEGIRFYARHPKLGCGKDYRTVEAAIAELFYDHACTNIRIEDVPAPVAPISVKVRKAVYGPKLTLAIVRELLSRVGVTIRSADGEFRINVRGASEEAAGYQCDLSDALDTGRAMADRAADRAAEEERRAAIKRMEAAAAAFHKANHAADGDAYATDAELETLLSDPLAFYEMVADQLTLSLGLKIYARTVYAADEIDVKRAAERMAASYAYRAKRAERAAERAAPAGAPALPPVHVETLARAGLSRDRASAILSAQGLGEPLCLHMSAAEVEAVRNVWLADDMPGSRSFRDTVVLISKSA